MASQTATTTIIFNAQDRVTSSVRRAGMAVARFRRRIQSVSGSISQMTNSVRGLTSQLPLIGSIGVGGIVMAGKSSIQTAAELESMGQAIKFASDNAVEGDKNLKFLRQTAKDLKIDYKAATEGFKMFSASMTGSAFKSKDQREMFLSMSKGIRVLGLDAEKSESVFRALGEMVSKGQIMAQELKQQLGNALPGAVGDLAQSLENAGFLKKGAGKKGLFELMSKKGGIDPMKVLKHFTEYLGKKYQPGVADALNTTSAKLTEIQNKWLWMTEDVGNALASSGVVEYISETITLLGDWVTANKKLIATKVKQAVEWVKDVGAYILANGDRILMWIKAAGVAFVAMKVAVAGLNIAAFLTNPVGLAVAGLGLLATAFIRNQEAMAEWREGIKKGKVAVEEFAEVSTGLDNVLGGIFGDDSQRQALGWKQIVNEVRRDFIKFQMDVFNLIGRIGQLTGFLEKFGGMTFDQYETAFIDPLRKQALDLTGQNLAAEARFLTKGAQTALPGEFSQSLMPSYLNEAKKENTPLPAIPSKDNPMETGIKIFIDNKNDSSVVSETIYGEPIIITE